MWQSGLFLVAIATLGMAMKGIFARFVYQHGVSVDALLVWRFALAVPMFWLGALWLNRHKPKAPLTARQWQLCLLTGALFFLSAWCDFNAIHQLGASVSRILLYLFPALLLVIHALQYRRMPPGLQVAVFAAAWVGMLLLLIPGWQGGAIGAAGIAFGLGAATCYALFLWLSQGVMREIGSVRFNQVSNSFTLVLMALLLLPGTTAGELALDLPALGWMLALVLFSTALPYFLMLEGVHRAGASEAGIVAMFGPVLTVMMAVALFPDERLQPLQWLGALLVLLGIGALTMARPPGKAKTHRNA
ncbi:DMT family transporter [Haliea sp. E17]|uniref:DMT family transporter n=1 Tax=Haliea sp. E17 TaxID=3401576 RepID=UPI003AAFB0F9